VYKLFSQVKMQNPTCLRNISSRCQIHVGPNKSKIFCKIQDKLHQEQIDLH